MNTINASCVHQCAFQAKFTKLPHVNAALEHIKIIGTQTSALESCSMLMQTPNCMFTRLVPYTASNEKELEGQLPSFFIS